MPKIVFPQLATLVNQPPEGKEWFHEIKFDGYRIIAFKNAKKIRLMSRNNHEWTTYFENVAKAIKKLFSKNIILDGEIVLLDKKQLTNFQLLQNAVHANNKKSPFFYYIFDILYYDKYDLTQLSILERKKFLAELMRDTDNSVLRYSDHILGNGAKIYKKACKMKLEGIVSKNINSKYEEKRTKTWLKSKCIQRQEFVIGGFSPPQGSRGYFGSLYLGYFEKGKLIFCGNVGTGFNQASLKNIYAQLKKNIIATNPFTTNPPGVTSATWVKPKLIAEVEFTEWTSEGSLRHPSFKGLREDKSAKSIKREVKTNVKRIKSK